MVNASVNNLTLRSTCGFTPTKNHLDVYIAPDSSDKGPFWIKWVPNFLTVFEINRNRLVFVSRVTSWLENMRLISHSVENFQSKKLCVWNELIKKITYKTNQNLPLIFQHVKIHTNEKAFGCSYCPRFFRQRTILNQVSWPVRFALYLIFRTITLELSNCIFLFSMWGYTRGRSHTSVVNVGRISGKRLFSISTQGLIKW